MLKAVYLGEDGFSESWQKLHSILVDMTTSTPDLAKRIYEAGQA